MKTGYKIMIDICMALLLVFCMKYDLTGNLLHEVIGVILLAAFIFHVIINRKYYKVTIHSKNIGRWSMKQIVSMLINYILLVSVAVMIISSIIISKDIFSFMKFDSGMYGVWRIVHIISAISILLYCFVHLMLHMSLFKGIIHKRVNRQDFEKIWSVSSKVIAVLMSIFVIVTSIRASQSVIRIEGHRIEDHRQNRHQEQSYETKKKPEEQEEHSEVIDDSSEDEDKLSLDDYLRSLTCDGCGKRCPLISPRCGRGVQQAEEAKVAYESEYGANDQEY